MRKLILAAGLLACLSLSACNEKPAEPAAATQAEAPRKSLARQAPFYAGQEQVLSIQSASAKADAGGGLNLEAKASTDGAGWTQVGFLPASTPRPRRTASTRSTSLLRSRRRPARRARPPSR